MVMEILDWQCSQTDGFPVPEHRSSFSDESGRASDLNAWASFRAAEASSPAGSARRVDDRRMLRMQFRQDLLDYAQQIEAAITEERFDDLGRLAHRLKGSCSMYGYQSISQAALHVEHALCHAKVPFGLKDRLKIVETAHKLSACCLESTVE